MICPRCGESQATDATVCSSCGLDLSSSSEPEQRCPVCGANLAASATVCPHCGTSLAPKNHAAPVAYEPPPDDELSGPPTIPYAQSRYARPPIMRTVPPLSTSDATTSVTAENDATWTNMPPLSTPTAPEDVPFATTAAAEPEQPATPDGAEAPAASDSSASSDSDGLPDYDTPDIERPAIHVPKPPLPDYDTPEIERPAVRTPQLPLPDYDTPDDERPTVHPSLANTVANGHLPPTDAPAEPVAGNGVTSAPVLDATSPMPVYPDTYAGRLAAHIASEAGSASSRTAPASAQTASDNPFERFFGPQPSPRERTANTAIQRLWLRYLPPEWATAPWISIPVGALIALVAGLLVTIIGLLFWSRAMDYLLGFGSRVSTETGLLGAIVSPNLLQLFLLEHGVPMSLTLGSPGATGSFSALETLPLTGLSLIAACALILAGYVAAASDFSHILRFSIVRGALVGPVYAVLLLLVALFGSSTTHIAQGTTIQLHPSLGHAFLTGLIWGTLLGALGGLLAIRRHHLFTTNRQPDLLAGASWGALIALGSGLLLAAVALVAGMAAHVIGTMPTATAASSGDGILGALGALITTISLLIVVAPVGVLWLFALGTGATIDSWITASGTDLRAGTSTFGLLIAQHHPSSVAWWLLLLIPLASYIIGGRAAAHIARADSLRDGALVGWLMAVAMSLLTLLLTLLMRVLVSSDATLFDRTVTASLGIAPSAGAVFLLVLLGGGIVGALGGVSALLAPEPGPLLVSLSLPLLAKLTPALSLIQRPWDMLDAARNRHPARTPLRALVYAAVLSAVVLVALFVLAVMIGWIASHVAPISAIRGFDGFFAGVAVGVPLLLLASAAILAVMQTLPPLLTKHRVDVPIMPKYPSA
jgi:Double zinc ribbon